MTALATSPFFTFALGIASWTDTTMMSPIEAYLRLEPPSTLMQSSFFAPELSATSSVDSIWIMDLDLLRALDEADDAPALVARGRTRLDDLDLVARLELVLLVVRLVLDALGDELVEAQVLDAA